MIRKDLYSNIEKESSCIYISKILVYFQMKFKNYLAAFFFKDSMYIPKPFCTFGWVTKNKNISKSCALVSSIT